MKKGKKEPNMNINTWDFTIKETVHTLSTQLGQLNGVVNMLGKL